MMTTFQYDFSTAEAVCNDATADTWEVRAKGSDGKWWTVSDSTKMSMDEATWLAEEMRTDAAQC